MYGRSTWVSSGRRSWSTSRARSPTRGTRSARPTRRRTCSPPSPNESTLPLPVDVLPHRPPFLFVDEVTRLEPGTSATGTWALSGEEWFFAGHFPGRPTLPGVLMCEAIAQVGAIAVLDGRSLRRQVAVVRRPRRRPLADKSCPATRCGWRSSWHGCRHGPAREAAGPSSGDPTGRSPAPATCSSSSSTREFARNHAQSAQERSFLHAGAHRARLVRSAVGGTSALTRDHRGPRVMRSRSGWSEQSSCSSGSRCCSPSSSRRSPRRRDCPPRLRPRDRRPRPAGDHRSPDVPDSAVQWQAERESARRPLSGRLGRQPSAVALRRHGAADLVVRRDRSPRRRSDVDAPGQHRLRRRRRGAHLPARPRPQRWGRRIGVAAAAIAALVPQGHVLFSEAMNDGLGFAAATAVVWAGVRCIGTPSGRWSAAIWSCSASLRRPAPERAAPPLIAVVVVLWVAVTRLVTAPSTVGSRSASASTVAAYGLVAAAVLSGGTTSATTSCTATSPDPSPSRPVRPDPPWSRCSTC